jgi:hypothetical protein
VNKTDNPRSARRRAAANSRGTQAQETMLARVMLVAIDLVLSGEGLGLETALDLVREVWHCYPELSAHWDEV